MFFSSRDCTTIFLHAIVPSEYADVVTTFQTSVDAYRHPDNDGILLDHFRINGIASLIHNNAKHHVQDIHSPHIHRVAGLDTTWDNSDEDELAFCHLQGYCPRVFHLKQDNRDHGSPRNANRGSPGCYGPLPPRLDTPQGRFT